MDQRSWIILALMTLFCLCTSGLAAQQWMARTDLEHVNSELHLGQLVEHFCIENPAGSGRWIHDAKILTCPGGARCVSGECLH